MFPEGIYSMKKVGAQPRPHQPNTTDNPRKPRRMLFKLTRQERKFLTVLALLLVFGLIGLVFFQ